MKNFFQKVWRVVWKSIIGFLIISIVSTLIFRWLPIPVTPLMLIRCAEQKLDGKEIKLHKNWQPFDKLSKHLQLAVVCSEDQNFIEHNGFDFEAIDKAMTYNEHHKKKRGASTISQQTAKNVFLWPGRSWLRKGFEVYFTFLIECVWNKQRIMEVYLNIIEIGNGVYGAQAAAKDFFGKDAMNLSKTESASIAAVLPNPLKFSVKNPSAYLIKRQGWILNQMVMWGGVLNYEIENNNKKKK